MKFIKSPSYNLYMYICNINMMILYGIISSNHMSPIYILFMYATLFISLYSDIRIYKNLYLYNFLNTRLSSIFTYVISTCIDGF